MKICVVGAGYVGLTTATALADFGHEVQCVDIDQDKIETLNKGEIPIYEPGLKELVGKCVQEDKLRFSVDVNESVRDYPIIIIAVGTPPLEDGRSNLSYIEQVLETIASTLREYKLIITKSTVPLGTNEWMHRTLLERGIGEELFDIVSNPEFLREGRALWDIYNPNKIVFGTKSNRPVQTLKKLYQKGQAPYIFTSLTGAELIKYASNAFLATKISFANEMARICDAYDVDYSQVAKGIGTDPRIGGDFLNAGLGFGGSCLPKDLSALKNSALKKDLDTILLDAVMEINKSQVEFCVKKLTSVLQNLEGKQITIWGVTFKPGTDDLRSSPSLNLIEHLRQKGCHIHTYDPMVELEMEGVSSFSDLYGSVHGSEALIIATEWEEFTKCDWTKVKEEMKSSILLDARNCIDAEAVKEAGFAYLGVGKI